MSKLSNAFEETINAVYETYGHVPKNLDGIGQYMEERLTHIQAALVEDMFEYDEMYLVNIEQHNVAMKLGISLSKASKAMDHAIASAIFGMLTTALHLSNNG